MSIHRIHRVFLSSVGYRIASTLAAAALLGALIVQLVNSDAGRSRVAGDAAVHRDTVLVDPTGPHSLVERREAHDLRARSDMRAYALRNGILFETEGALIAEPEWCDQWSLYHLDVRSGGEVVRIYEAVDRLDPDRRFTAIWDPIADRATEWELVLD